MAIRIVLDVPEKHVELFTLAVRHFYAVAPKIVENIKLLPPDKHHFSYTNLSSVGVGNLLFTKLHSSEMLLIRTYKSKWPWSKAIAYAAKNDGPGNVIYFNERRLTQLYKDIAGTIAHEFCHEICGFGHGSDTPSALKELSVPYAFGYLVSGRSSYPLV